MSVEKLLNEIEDIRSNWNERSNFTLKGVRNLSQSDLDTLVLYAETYRDNFGSFNGLIQPLGSIEKVLDKYDIKEG